LAETDNTTVPEQTRQQTFVDITTAIQIAQQPKIIIERLTPDEGKEIFFLKSFFN